MSVYTSPSKKSLLSILGKVRALTRRSEHHGLADLLGRLNPVLRGWCNYFRHGVSKATFGYLDAFTWHRVTQWICKTTPGNHVAGPLPAFPDRKARKPARGQRDHDVRHRDDTHHTVPVASIKHPDTVGHRRLRSGYPWSAGCDESRMSGAEGGSGKRAGSNPGTAPARPYITGAHNQSAIATLVERSTRYVMLVHLPGDHTAETVREGLITTIGSLPAHLRGSLTWDQGVEMANHKAFSIATDMDVYFCDPHSPWQRGSNENTNGLRQYFPKGTDLNAYGPKTSNTSPRNSTPAPAKPSPGTPRSSDFVIY